MRPPVRRPLPRKLGCLFPGEVFDGKDEYPQRPSRFGDLFLRLRHTRVGRVFFRERPDAPFRLLPFRSRDPPEGDDALKIRREFPGHDLIPGDDAEPRFVRPCDRVRLMSAFRAVEAGARA